jgi:hypothetical protein
MWVMGWVLKVHGSENFHRDRVIGSENDKALMFTVNESIFPKSGRLRHFCYPEADSSDAIIAPSFVKVISSPFTTLMLEALDAASDAETLVIIGCALRREDSFLYLLVWRYLQGLLKGPRRLLVVDPEADTLCGLLSETLEYDLSFVIESINDVLESAQAQLVGKLRG